MQTSSLLLRVEPFDGERLSHSLGRFRRAKDLTPTGLGKAAGLGGAIARWEKFRLNPPPSRQELEALATVVGPEADRLAQMIPPAGVGMKLEPIRLCGACYTELPCQKIEWQFKATQGCDRSFQIKLYKFKRSLSSIPLQHKASGYRKQTLVPSPLAALQLRLLPQSSTLPQGNIPSLPTQLIQSRFTNLS